MGREVVVYGPGSLCQPLLTQDAGEMRPPTVQMGVCYLVPRNTGADFAD